MVRQFVSDSFRFAIGGNCFVNFGFAQRAIHSGMQGREILFIAPRSHTCAKGSIAGNDAKGLIANGNANAEVIRRKWIDKQKNFLSNLSMKRKIDSRYPLSHRMKRWSI
jgi:hypothetical protein